MTTKRYKFTGERKTVDGVVLKQIIRLSDGALGGWIKDQKCLPQEGSGWVLQSAMVLGGEVLGGIIGRGKMYGGVMHGGVMHGGVMLGGEMHGGKMYCGEMRGGVMHDGVLWGGVIHGGEMRGGGLLGGAMYGGEMRGGTLRGGVIHKGMIVTRDPIHLILPKHHITVADNMAAVGCKVHDFAHWRSHIEEIGRNHGYSKDEVAFYKSMLFPAMDRMDTLNAEAMAAKKPKKKTDECLCCRSRSCYERVVDTDGGKTYDEVACRKHVNDLHKHSDTVAPGVLKHFISSTGKQKRGEPFSGIA